MLYSRQGYRPVHTLHLGLPHAAAFSLKKWLSVDTIFARHAQLICWGMTTLLCHINGRILARLCVGDRPFLRFGGFANYAGNLSEGSAIDFLINSWYTNIECYQLTSVMLLMPPP